MRYVAICLLVVLTACSDAPTSVGIEPTGTARKVWQNGSLYAEWMKLGGDGSTLHVMRPDRSPPNVIPISTATGIELADPLLSDKRVAHVSPDGRFLGCADRDEVAIYRIADGEKIAFRKFDRPSWDENYFYLSWDLTGSSLFVWCIGRTENGLFEIKNQQDGESVFHGLPTSGDADGELHRLGALASSPRMQVSRHLLFDPSSKSFVGVPPAYRRDFCWPHANGTHWFVLRDDILIRVDANGTELSTLPLNLRGEAGEYYPYDFVTSTSGHYVALLLRSGFSEYQHHVWVVDTRDASHRCHIALDDPSIDKWQFAFDPKDDRTLYTLSPEYLTKWRIE